MMCYLYTRCDVKLIIDYSSMFSIAEDKKTVYTREFKKEMVPSLAYALLQVAYMLVI